MIHLVVHGAHGRMGRRIDACCATDDRFEITARLGRDDAFDDAVPTDVIIDFSTDSGTRRAAAHAAARGAALLVGTTALSAETLDEIDVSARSVPVLIAPNTALGVAVFSHLAVVAARLLGPGAGVRISDVHHAAKVDAPSGTARRLLDLLRRGAGRAIAPEDVHCTRAGDIVGEHEIEFFSAGERLAIRHSATSRDVFARGALEAAAWLHGRPAGRYVIEDALGLPGDAGG